MKQEDRPEITGKEHKPGRKAGERGVYGGGGQPHIHT